MSLLDMCMVEIKCFWIASNLIGKMLAVKHFCKVLHLSSP